MLTLKPMDTSESNPNRKSVEEITAVLQAAAAEMLHHETEPAFSYFIETATPQVPGDAE
jgi:hypothetical protein